jgi:hypothetical protein
MRSVRNFFEEETFLPLPPKQQRDNEKLHVWDPKRALFLRQIESKHIAYFGAFEVRTVQILGVEKRSENPTCSVCFEGGL